MKQLCTALLLLGSLFVNTSMAQDAILKSKKLRRCLPFPKRRPLHRVHYYRGWGRGHRPDRR